MLKIKLPHPTELDRFTEAVFHDDETWEVERGFLPNLRRLLADVPLWLDSSAYYPTLESKYHAAFIAIGIEVVEYKQVELSFPDDREY